MAPEVMERVKRSVEERASRPMPSMGVGEWHREESRGREREMKLIGSARLGLVPVLVDGEEWFRHKDELVTEDLALMADWHEAEAEAWEAEVERARFVEDVLRDLEGIQHAVTGVPEARERPGIRGGIVRLADYLKGFVHRQL